jgi:hypothetical protein
MNSYLKAAPLFMSLSLGFAAGPACAGPVHDYVFYGTDRERISDPEFLGTPTLEGAQLSYTWRQLEHGEDGYDFREIETDLAQLNAHGKRLFIQLVETTFDVAHQAVPQYLVKNPRYNGGAVYQYDDKGEPEGWVARRWDPAVRDRFQRLLSALGNAFDGRIAGINLQETSIGVTEGGPHAAPGFTYTGYRDAIKSNMKALRGAFHRSVVMQYANFMPGEWLQDDDHSYLRSIYQYGREIGVGMGAPDLMPGSRSQQNHAYRFMRESNGGGILGIAVQDGNYAGKTGEDVKPTGPWENRVPALFDFAAATLKVDYIFWGAQEPYFSHDVVPFLNARK